MIGPFHSSGMPDETGSIDDTYTIEEPIPRVRGLDASEEIPQRGDAAETEVKREKSGRISGR